MKDPALENIHGSFEQRYPEWMAEARAIGYQIAEAEGEVTVDDVQKHLKVPAGCDGRIWGTVFQEESFHFGGVRTQKNFKKRVRDVTVWKLDDTYSCSIEKIRDGLFVWYNEAGQVGGASNYYVEAKRQLDQYAENL